MRITVSIKYLRKESRSGIYRYRRRVPEDLRLVIGKTFIDQSLETTDEATAIERRGPVHQKIEVLFQELRKPGADKLEYETSLKILKDAELVTEGTKKMSPVLFETAPPNEFDKLTNAILSEGDEKKQALLLKAKFKGVDVPPVRMEEAIRVYLDERGGTNFENLQKQTKLAARELCRVKRTNNPILGEVTYEDAYLMRDDLLNAGKSPATVKKRLGSLKAVYNVAIRRMNLPDLVNPFGGITLPVAHKDIAAAQKKQALSPEEIWRCLPEINKVNDEARDIWHLAVLTGARRSEICRLRWSDIFLEDTVPHLRINAGSGRPIKTDGSERGVPLVGHGVELLRLRMGESPKRQDADVFPRYAGINGSNKAYPVLANAMKNANVWVKTLKTPNSLRHAHKDWMRKVAREELTNRIHGHGRRSIANDYGSDEFMDELLRIMEEGLSRAGLLTYPFVGQ